MSDVELPTNIEEREEAFRLFTAVYEAKKAYADHPLTVFDTYDGDVMRCAKSGIIIVDGDEYVEDLETNETFLRSALGLPPRPEEAEVEIVDDDDWDATMDDESECEPA